MGSPWGLDSSVSFGIVSALGRHGIGQARHHTLLQTDAMLQPGNSGGALVNAKGELIGINTAIVGDSFRGISFAIPSNMAREVYSRLKKDGEIPRGWLGVRLATAPRSGSDRKDIGAGAIVVYVFKSSPADVAGIRAGDIVKDWQNTTIENASQLSQLVAQTMAGDTAEVSLLRGEQKISLSVTVGRRPAQLQ
jgi:S1-C subfamily serine protease